MQTLARGISYVDLEFLGHHRVIATAVLETERSLTLVNPGPSSCLDTLRSKLGDLGVGLPDVTSLLLTHIHLDHAGATGSILRENPEIEVYVHERGAPHMVDPSKLLASATRLYGADMDRLWGEFVPVPEARVHALRGGEVVAAGERELEVAYTPGHASHHVSYFDPSTGVAFVGDTAGIRIGPERLAMPPTPPPDIDIEAWRASIERIRAWRASTLFVTHFGPHEDPDAHLDDLLQHLDAMSDIARRCLERDQAEDDEARRNAFVHEMHLHLQRHLPSSKAALYDYAAPLDQCWLGLARYWRKRGVGV